MPTETALQIVEPSNSQLRPQTFAPSTFNEALIFAERLAKSSLVPKDFQGHADNILVAIQHGAEIGLQPLQSLNSIAVINGRPAIFGDAALAIVKAHRDFEWIKEEVDEQNLVATCIVKRRGQPEVMQKFSKADAALAGLWEKQGPWKQYPKRMLKMRARGFALRDAFPDALRGIITAEEAQDIGPVIESTAIQQNQQAQTAQTVVAETSPAISLEDATKWYRTYRAHGWTPDEAKAWLKEKLKIEDGDSRKITAAQYPEALKWAETKAPIVEEVAAMFATLGWTAEEQIKCVNEHKANYAEIKTLLSSKIDELNARQ